MGAEKERRGDPSVPSLYATIPAAVRYDQRLRPNAKLIYGEIAALTSAYGYCWARNRYFAKVYGFNKNTVSAYISELAELGYITVDVCKTNTGEVDERKIWLNVNFTHPPYPSNDGYPLRQTVDTPTPNGEYPILQKKDTPPPKNEYPIHQTAKENNINTNIYPPTPQGEAHYDAHFDVFWSAYPRKVDKQKAQRVFRRLRVDEATLKDMLAALEQQKRSPQWVKDGGTFIPYPTTWLNNRRWEAEPAAPTASAPTVVIESEEVPEW